MSELAPGTIVDKRYRVIATIGAGGMGCIYRAIDQQLERLVALKIIQPELINSRETQERFVREGRALSAISHPNILQCYHFGVWNDQCPYIAMEYVEGLSLRQLMSRGDVSIEQALTITTQVCEGLQAAHDAHIIHRDVTPANIMLHQNDTELTAKIIDFGLARVLPSSNLTGQTLTATGFLVGSVRYMSPEQCRGARADGLSDIYALGCVLYELIAGTAPFDADNPLALMQKHITLPPPPLPPRDGTPIGLENCVLRALQKLPADRYQSMRAFREDIEHIAAGKGSRVLPPATMARITIKKRVCMIALLLLLICSGVVSIITMKNGSRKTAVVPASPIHRLLKSDTELAEGSTKHITYLRSWLRVHGSDITIDGARARERLAGFIEVSSPSEGLTLRKQTISICTNLIDLNQRAVNGTVAKHIVGLLDQCTSKMDIETRIRVMSEMHSKLQQTQSDDCRAAIVLCRYSLASALYKRLAYEDATKVLELEQSEAPYSLSLLGQIEWLVLLAQCHIHTGKQSAAKQAISMATNLLLQLSLKDNWVAFSGEKQRVVHSSNRQLKLNFCTALFSLGFPEFCIQLATDLEETDLPDTDIERAQLYLAHTNSLLATGQVNKAAELLEKRLARHSSFSNWLYMWSLLWRVDQKGHLKKAGLLKESLRQRVLDMLPRTRKPLELAVIIHDTRVAAAQCTNDAQPECAKEIARTVLLTRAHWTANNIQSIFIPLTASASQLQSLGLFNESSSILEFLRSPANSGLLSKDAYRTPLMTALSWQLFFEKHFEEALKMCDDLIARLPPRSEMRMQAVLTKVVLLRKMGNCVEAKAMAMKCVDAASTSSLKEQFLLQTAAADIDKEEGTSAEQVLRHIIETSTGTDAVQVASLNLAKLYHSQRRLREARECCVSLQYLRPTNVVLRGAFAPPNILQSKSLLNTFIPVCKELGDHAMVHDLTEDVDRLRVY